MTLPTNLTDQSDKLEQSSFTMNQKIDKIDGQAAPILMKRKAEDEEKD
ncbi:MAG: hypothetical protein OIF58_00945 [Cohaesibacter sp.]|nr:hypothetical protein [Cohaesibacter sp.]